MKTLARRLSSVPLAQPTAPGAVTDLVSRYRGLLRNVPSPVAVVTTGHPDTQEKRGITVSSLTSVSLRPPVVSFCVDNPSRMSTLLEQSGRFAAHILSKDQVALSVAFSTPTRDPFESTVAYYTHAETMQPVLIGTLGVMLCDVVGRHHVGDHVLWLGEVKSVEFEETGGGQGAAAEPLLYYHRGYHSVGEEAFMHAFEDRSLQFNLWTHRMHVRMAWNYLRAHGLAEGTSLIRDGIRHYNEKNKNLLTVGYHETTTLFFIHLVWTALQVLSKEAKKKKKKNNVKFFSSHPGVQACRRLCDLFRHASLPGAVQDHLQILFQRAPFTTTRGQRVGRA